MLPGLTVAAALAVLPRTASAQVIADGYEGDGLVRKMITIPAGGTMTASTSGCLDNDDTVMYLLEGTFGNEASLTTRGYSDDYNGTLCSRIVYTNTAAGAKYYVLLLVNYDNSAATVDFSVSTTGGGTTFAVANQHVRGVRVPTRWGRRPTSFGPRPTTVLTKPLSPDDAPGGSFGYGVHDTVLFAINRSIGGAARADDDSGIGNYSQLNMGDYGGCDDPDYCHIVAGSYYDTGGGLITIWNNERGNYQHPANEGDFDHDQIGDVIEDYYGTNKYSKDSDGDQIDDDEEYLGMPREVGGVPQLAGSDTGLILPNRGASPLIPDVFLEIDYMDGGAGDNHRPYTRVAPATGSLVQDMYNTFNNSAYHSRNLRLHVEIGQNVGHTTLLNTEPCVLGAIPGRVSLRQYKTDPAFFDPIKAQLYHYAVAGHSLFDSIAADPSTMTPASCDANPQGSSGRGEGAGNDFVITYTADSAAEVAAGRERRILGTYLHELGHNLGLGHNGNDLAGLSCVHSSVMSYAYQFPGVANGEALPQSRYTYSIGTCDASSSVSVGATCANTCVSRCVPYGQPSSKSTCPLVPTGGPFGGFIRRSDGVCDCDVDEWTGITATRGGTAWYSGAGREERDAIALGTANRYPGLAEAAAGARRAALVSRGQREGVDFEIDPRSGKAYAIERAP